MKKLSGLNTEQGNKLDTFLQSNKVLEFKKTRDKNSSLITYEIRKQFSGSTRSINIMKFESHKPGEIYFFSTLKEFIELRENMNLPYNMRKNGGEIYGFHLPVNKLIRWLNDPENELLWFPENSSF
ncbi:hypothetical protein SKC35_07055 [Aquirufa sp. KTFRIE-69F]|uniref:Uncharacterized protein n=1 Tax=Aquirufa originis TaxID=3096514 RepID=A0ABW6D5F7_9BACT